MGELAVIRGSDLDGRLTFTPRYDGFTFDRESVEPITQNNDWIKPNGGFYASVDGSWEDFLEGESWFGRMVGPVHRVLLRDDARVCVIDSMAALDQAPVKRMWLDSYCLDFEGLAQDYDAMMVMAGSNRDLYWGMYGWDVDQVLVFREDAIESVEPIGAAKELRTPIAAILESKGVTDLDFDF